ncbi:MAG: FAD-dependent oxidoreductase [Desulfarculaceae bacterium]|jgi:thioredoxin reductase (NADPH)
MGAKEYQVIVMGTGPAGLQAAIHAVRKKASVLVLGRQPKSSLFKAHVENFCCITGMPGVEMLEMGRQQAQEFGAEFLEEDVIETGTDDGWFLIKTESGTQLHCRALVLAMGIHRNRLGAKGEKELLGRGVSYCVDCDADFFRGEKVAVAGGESAAVAGALTLLFLAEEVHLVCDRLQVSEALSQRLQESAILVHSGRKIKHILGQEKVTSVELDDGTKLEVAGVFIELGAKGAIELAAGLGVDLDPENMQYVLADKKQQTNLPGIYAAGDITGPPWQMAKAVGEGCVAGLEAADYAKKLT